MSRAGPQNRIPCSCYRFDLKADDPSTCLHCWHEQFDIKARTLRLHCGRCGKWRDIFD